MNIYGGGRRSARRSMVPVSVRVRSCIALAFPVNMALSCTTSTLSPPYQSEIGKMTPHTRFDEVEITLEITLATPHTFLAGCAPGPARARRAGCRVPPPAQCASVGVLGAFSQGQAAGSRRRTTQENRTQRRPSVKKRSKRTQTTLRPQPDTIACVCRCTIHVVEHAWECVTVSRRARRGTRRRREATPG